MTFSPDAFHKHTLLVVIQEGSRASEKDDGKKAFSKNISAGSFLFSNTLNTVDGSEIWLIS